MVQNADQIGPAVTTGEDPRITRVGRFIRRLRLDEFSQLLNVLNGTMSLVGPRPEVRKYVDLYTPEQMATLLVRPGITAPSSIAFKDEDKLLDAADDPERVYVEQILPPKNGAKPGIFGAYLSPLYDLSVIFQTAAAVFLSGGKRMRNEFSRSQILLGTRSMERLRNSRVAVFGLGGVGSFAAEALSFEPASATHCC